MSEHIEDHAKLYEAARSLRKTGMPMTWRADEISSVLDELIRLRHIVASGLAVSINQENKQLRADNEALIATGKVLGSGVDILGPRCDQLKAENERLERNRDMWKGQVERQAEELASLRSELRVMDVLAEAMAEVKATSDGESTQPIAGIVSGCLAEIATMDNGEQP